MQCLGVRCSMRGEIFSLTGAEVVAPYFSAMRLALAVRLKVPVSSVVADMVWDGGRVLPSFGVYHMAVEEAGLTPDYVREELRKAWGVQRGLVLGALARVNERWHAFGE